MGITFPKIIAYIKKSRRRKLWLLTHFCDCFKNDRKYLEKWWYYYWGYEIDLDNPQTYNEKLQWLKLYDRKDIYTQMVDKVGAKDYVASIIGSEYVIPTIAVYNSVDEIDWASLPNQFVMKCAHDSGGNIICKDKNKLNITAAEKKLRKCLKSDYFMLSREWPYKNVPRRIIVEEYMEDKETAELRDYKFFCFNGEVKAMFVATERQVAGEDVKFDFFDSNYNHLPLRQGHQNAKKLPQKPKNFELMKDLAEQLSADIPEVRIDFYDCNGKVYFGEITFFHFSGMVNFEPEEWDLKFGKWITLPNKTVK